MLTHLLLMRHAKSSWKDQSLADHARPLNKRGRREADIIARTLTAKGFAPDIIWSSDAERTSETAARLISIMPGAQSIIRTAEFYHASSAKVIAQCIGQNEPSGRLMLLGHNPGWSELALHFTGREINLPTAGCLIFKREDQNYDDWISPKHWRLVDYLEPASILPRDEDEETIK